MNNNLFSTAAAQRTRFIAANPCMRGYVDTSAIAPVPAAKRVAADAPKSTHVGFEQGRPPRGVPR